MAPNRRDVMPTLREFAVLAGALVAVPEGVEVWEPLEVMEVRREEVSVVESSV